MPTLVDKGYEAENIIEDIGDSLAGLAGVFGGGQQGSQDQGSGDGGTYFDDYGSYYGGGYSWGGNSGGSGGSSKQKAKDAQLGVAKYNANAIRAQLNQQLANLNMANEQNARLATKQRKENSIKMDSDRFESYRDFLNAMMSLNASTGIGLNGSATGNLMRMARDRNDSDTNKNLTQLVTNRNAIDNAEIESRNQNNLSMNEAISNAEKALHDLSADTSSRLFNIDQEYVAPGTGATDYGAYGLYDTTARGANLPTLSGYPTPDYNGAAVRNVNPATRLSGNDYYSRLVNSYTRR